MPGFNSKISYDPTNKLTLIIWTNLTASLDGQQTANTLFVKMLDQVYKVSPLRYAQASTPVRAIRRHDKAAGSTVPLLDFLMVDPRHACVSDASFQNVQIIQ